MDEVLLEAAESIENAEVKKWKEAGGRVVGYVCSHVPEEVMAAAGVLPFRLRGIQTASTAIGDTYFGPFICSCPKALLQNAGEGRFDFLDGAVMVQACDSMRRLDECWRKAGEEKAVKKPDFFYYFAVPHKVTDYAVSFFAEEIRRFARALEEHFKVEISDQTLKEAIVLYNETRDLLAELEALRLAPDSPITGTEAMTLVLAGTALPKTVFNPLLKKALAGFKKRKKGKNADRLRVILAGSVVDDLTLIRAIEGEGAIVSGDTVCFGARAWQGAVDETRDPYETLAERYLNEQFCPRMFGYADLRYKLIVDKLTAAEGDGIIFQNIRFCDLHGSENGLFEKRLEKEGIPSMRVEREYGDLADEGRVRLRVGAFLETLAARREKKSSAA